MKVVCEIPLNVANYNQSQFNWIDGNENLLFVIEDGKRLRLLGLQQEIPREVETASLAENRLCTNSSWNRDGSLLAVVVDRRQIYLWEFKTNSFTHFKPQIDQSNSLIVRRNQRPRDIELVAWSKQSDRLAICYSSGQILLCKFVQTANVWEKFIDNSESVLKKIVAIEVSEHADVFACLSLISEVLVMTFEGQTKFYLQGDNLNLFNLKFSNPINEYNQQLRKEFRPPSTVSRHQQQAIWLAYQSKSDGMFFKKISFDHDEFQDVKPVLNVLHNGQEASSHLVDFFWLNSQQLIACFSSGAIHLVQISSNSMLSESSTTVKLNYEEKYRIDPTTQDDSVTTTPPIIDKNTASESSQSSKDRTFKIFKLIKCPTCPSDPSRQAFALLAATSYKLFYYEFYEFKHRQPTSFEHVDDLDLGSSLRRVDLELKRAAWNLDCSLLALQLTSGHLLVYRTRLQDYMVALYGSKTAYLSASNEITILNYENSADPLGSVHGSSRRQSDLQSLTSGGSSSAKLKMPPVDLESRHSPEMASDNALIINVGLKPSVLAIGPHHLALALNNRIRLYSIESCRLALSNAVKTMPYYEEDFVTIVVGLGMCSNYVAILFDDGRLKLQTIHATTTRATGDKLLGQAEEQMDQLADNERFFPDPSKPESITAFTLTEDLLLYSTDKLTINIFSLHNWTMVQTCDHSNLLERPIRRLKSNSRGNKFVCLLSQESSTTINNVTTTSNSDSLNVYLFDLYYNQVIPITGDHDVGEPLSWKIFTRQLEEVSKMLPYQLITSEPSGKKFQCGSVSIGEPKLNDLRCILDAIWDTDGRTLFLVERKTIHVVAVLDHTLQSEPPIVEIAGSTPKSPNYNVLYVTQGIVSYQSSLGRVINSILETHDDELKLNKLEQQIVAIKNQVESTRAPVAKADHDTSSLEPRTQDEIEVNLLAQCKIMFLKLTYLQTIFPIYSLTKCRDICNHLVSDEQLRMPPDEKLIQSNANYRSCSRLIEQLIWRQLAAYAIYCSNLNFALSIYREHRLLFHAHVLAEILQDLRKNGRDSRQTIKNMLLSQLLML